MPQSLARISMHLIFSTKDRRRVFRLAKMRDGVAAYITGILKNQDCPLMRIGVVTDHVHILYSQSRTKTIADVVATVKRESSTWIKKQEWAHLNPDFAQFHWQNGYGIFSVSESRIKEVVKYIDNQMEHHKRASFQDEYRAFLKRHNIPFDERYVWE